MESIWPKEHKTPGHADWVLDTRKLALSSGVPYRFRVLWFKRISNDRSTTKIFGDVNMHANAHKIECSWLDCPGTTSSSVQKSRWKKIVCAVVASGHPRHEPSDLSSSDEGMLQNYQNLVPWNETAISILMLIPWFRSSCAWVVSNHVFKSISRDMTRAHNSQTSFSSKSDNNLLAWFPLIPIGILPDSLECPCYD